MPLEHVNTVDFIGLENDTHHAVLTIADSWDWTDEHSHLLALQAKLNAYFEFIESGQVWDSYPAAKGRQLRIDIIFRFAPPAKAIEFLAQASDVASELDVLVSHQTWSGQSSAEP